MSDLISTVSTAISLTKRLREINENIKNAEFTNILADLSLELAEVKLKMASLIEEKGELQKKIRELESIEGDPCPKCKKNGWQLEKSVKDSVFGDLGGIRRTYVCSYCGFSEEELVTPK
jgi:DNA repair exonuclease SbcCD ATPase subunit